MIIVAEVGQNHCGSMTLACELILKARKAGADLVKFQLYQHGKLYVNHPEIPNVELSFEQAKELFDYGASIGMEVFFSVFDVERVEWCEKIGVKRYKVAYSQNRNAPLLKTIAETRKPLIVSTSWDKRTRSVFPSVTPFVGNGYPLTYLYCVPEYPAPFNHIEMPYFGKYSNVGFSDHTIGLTASEVALARGACVVERHFAIDHETGIDAGWSMTPSELAEIVRWAKICQEVL